MRRHALAGNPLRTRADLERAVADLVDPLIPAYRAGGSRPDLGPGAAIHDRAAAQLEAFARPLWGVIPLVVGGGEFAHWDLIAAGLDEGTDPDRPGFWGEASDHDQRLVEMAAIGVLLAMAPDHVWERLDGDARRRLVAWLSRCNEVHLHDNNWQFFRVLVNLGLREVGAPTDDAAVERSLARIDADHLGSGWYEDGSALGCVDHYVAWAYQFYGLLYAVLAADVDPARCEVFRARARAFAGDFRRWFDRSGGVLPIGRSLTYRFASASFWAGLVVADEEALPWSTIKGIYLRHLRWWSQQDLARPDGLLGLGYAYDNPQVAETYSSAGSPYWAMKAFFALAAPADHPFWTASEEPAAEPGPPVAQADARMVVAEDAGHVVALNAGRGAWVWRQSPAKYGKLAYSSRYAFSLQSDDPWFESRTDSTLLLGRIGRRLVARRSVEASGVHLGPDDEPPVAWSRWSPFEGVSVWTLLTGDATWHLRVHVVQSDVRLHTLETGFALGWHGGEPGEQRVRPPHSSGEATVTTTAGTSAIVDIAGGRQAAIEPLAPNTNLVAPHVLVPCLRGDLPAGETRLVCHVGAAPPGVVLGGSPRPPAVDEVLAEIMRS